MSRARTVARAGLHVIEADDFELRKLTMGWYAVPSRDARPIEASIIGLDSSWSQGQGDGLWVKIDIDLRYVLQAGPDGVFKCMYPINLDGVLTAA